MAGKGYQVLWKKFHPSTPSDLRECGVEEGALNPNTAKPMRSGDPTGSRVCRGADFAITSSSFPHPGQHP
jgi:hypothetical protein